MGLFIRLREAVQDFLRKSDMVLLALCLISTAFGILLIASATNYRGSAFQLRRVTLQTVGTLLGIGAYFVFSNIDCCNSERTTAQETGPGWISAGFR